MNINIYVSYFKPYPLIPCDCFIPVQCARALTNVKYPMLGDDTGDNISKYNPQFSELTTQYWVWKQKPDCDYIGFFAYRRFFAFKHDESVEDITFKNCAEVFGLDKKTIESTIKDYDIIVPSSLDVGNMYKNTCNPYGEYFANKLISKMKEVKPEYSNAIDKFYNSNEAHLFNLYIMKNELYNEFCEFLFGTLLPLRDEIGDIPPFCNHSRFFGYTSEQFINIYINYLKETRNIKVLVLPPVRIFEGHNRYTFRKNLFDLPLAELGTGYY